MNGSKWKKSGLESLGDFLRVRNKEKVNILRTDYRCLIEFCLKQVCSLESRSLFQSFIPFFLSYAEMFKSDWLNSDASYYFQRFRAKNALARRAVATGCLFLS